MQARDYRHISLTETFGSLFFFDTSMILIGTHVDDASIYSYRNILIMRRLHEFQLVSLMCLPDVSCLYGESTHGAFRPFKIARTYHSHPDHIYAILYYHSHPHMSEFSFHITDANVIIKNCSCDLTFALVIWNKNSDNQN